MEVRSTSAPIFVSDFEAAIERYEALTRQANGREFWVRTR